VHATHWSISTQVGASCGVGCLISGLFVSRPGIYWFALWDSYVVWAVFIVVGIECVGVAYGYGAAKFSEEVQKGAGRAVPRFIQMCWSFVTPFLCAVLAVASFAALCAGGGRDAVHNSNLLDGVTVWVSIRLTG
jgi:SNF family Na+-dependent transporter